LRYIWRCFKIVFYGLKDTHFDLKFFWPIRLSNSNCGLIRDIEVLRLQKKIFFSLLFCPQQIKFNSNIILRSVISISIVIWALLINFELQNWQIEVCLINRNQIWSSFIKCKTQIGEFSSLFSISTKIWVLLAIFWSKLKSMN
jgi:hypothetical protein